MSTRFRVYYSFWEVFYYTKNITKKIRHKTIISETYTKDQAYDVINFVKKNTSWFNYKLGDRVYIREEPIEFSSIYPISIINFSFKQLDPLQERLKFINTYCMPSYFLVKFPAVDVTEAKK